MVIQLQIIKALTIVKIALVQTSVMGSILSPLNSEIKRARQQNLTYKESGHFVPKVNMKKKI